LEQDGTTRIVEIDQIDLQKKKLALQLPLQLYILLQVAFHSPLMCKRTNLEVCVLDAFGSSHFINLDPKMANVDKSSSK